MKILLVEDEPKVAAFIRKGLEEQGHEIIQAFDGAQGKKIFDDKHSTDATHGASAAFDLIILDLNLPFINGIELCRYIRKENLAVPVLMLTALGTTDDKVTGLEAGADDYLVKPFQFPELVARINALSRRKNLKVEDVVFHLADLSMNVQTMEVKRGETRIKLTAKEFKLLEMFFQSKGRLLSRVDIAETLWSEQFDSGSNVIDVYVNYLRNKIDKEYSPKLIHTVIGLGYIFREEP